MTLAVSPDASNWFRASGQQDLINENAKVLDCYMTLSENRKIQVVSRDNILLKSM